jgi:hypothetical protein
MAPKILQIMPAHGWAAVYSEDSDEMIAPLVAWALVETAPGETGVVGLVALEKVQSAEDQPNFTHYEQVDDEDFFFDPFEDEEFEEYEDEDDEDDEAAGEGPVNPRPGRLN